MNTYSVAVFILFEFNYLALSENLIVVKQDVTNTYLNNYLQMQKCILMCSYNENMINYSTSYILYNSACKFYLRNLYKKVKKKTPFPTIYCLKGLIKQTPIYDSPPIIRDHITNRSIEKEHITPFMHEQFNYNTKVQLTTEQNSSYSKSDYILQEEKILETIETTSKIAWMKYIPEIKEKKVIKDLFFDQFKQTLEKFDRKFYKISLNKLISSSPENKKQNGISFVQSGLLLYMALLALSEKVDLETKIEIQSCLMYGSSVMEEINILKNITAWLPVSNKHLKFRWGFRLVLEEGLQMSPRSVDEVDNANILVVQQLSTTVTRDNVLKTLNHMVEIDSGGLMKDTFIDDDFIDGFCSVLIMTMYVRDTWRSSPTVLNGTYPFKDGTMPHKSVKMIKLNDIMGYADLRECDAEAIEINYATPGLKLLMLLPRGNFLNNLTTFMETTSPQEISNRLRKIRIAAILPIFTLRMTLILPEKLKLMNISRLVDAMPGDDDRCGNLRLSHAVQRLMFWAEAGHNAFKDDGIEWDEKPDLELKADRPYLFYVRWKNVTIMNGNFVL